MKFQKKHAQFLMNGQMDAQPETNMPNQGLRSKNYKKIFF